MIVASLEPASDYRYSQGLDWTDGTWTILGSGPTTVEHLRLLDAAGELRWISADWRLYALGAQAAGSVPKARTARSLKALIIVAVAVVVAAVVAYSFVAATRFAGQLSTMGQNMQASQTSPQEASATLVATAGWKRVESWNGKGAKWSGDFTLTKGKALVTVWSTGGGPDGGPGAAIIALYPRTQWPFGGDRFSPVWGRADGGEQAVIIDVAPGRYHALGNGFGSWEATVSEPQ
jgi:hypothetical protein